MKKLCRMLLLLCAITIVFVLPAMAAEIVASGECGENVTWALDDEGVLTISGHGDMYDYQASYQPNPVPWKAYLEEINNVSIDYGIKKIGNYAFEDTSITSIIIPESVTYIGDHSFQATDLSSVVIPNSVTCIGSQSFADCSDLTSIIIPGSVESIGTGAFLFCIELSDVVISEGVTTLGDSTFGYCSALSEIHIPSTVKSIGTGVFISCSMLSSIFVENNNAYYQSINGVLFSKDGTELIAYPCNNEGIYNISDTVTTLSDYSFYDCFKLTHVTIPDSVTLIGKNVFKYCYNLMSITVDANNPSYMSTDGVLFSKDGKTLISCPNNVVDYIIPLGVTKIEDSAFRSNTNLESVYIPNSVFHIGNNAFRNCQELKKVIITENVSFIGDEAFSHSYDLDTVIFMGDVPNNIGELTFFDVAEDFALYYYSNSSGWTTPTWTAPDGTIYNTIMIDNDHNMTHHNSTANCNSTGYPEYWYCEICELTFADEAGTKPNLLVENAYDADNHIGGTEIRGTVEATEETEGYTGDTYCLGCETVIVEGEVIPVLDHVHDMTYHAAVAATCSTEGSVEYWSCSKCGLNYADETGTEELSTIATEIAPDNHVGETEVRDAVEATEETEGYTGDTYCLGCETIIEEGTVIPALTPVILPVPEILSCYSKTQTSVKVTWSTVEGVDGYELWRATSPDAAEEDWSRAKTITGADVDRYTNQGLEVGTTYYYKIRSVIFEEDGTRTCSEFSDVAYMPAAVVFDAPYSNATYRIRLRWNEISGAHGYQIWRMNDDGSYSIIKTIGDRGNTLTEDMGSVTAYSNTGLTAGDAYTYKMRAFMITEDGRKVFGAYSDEFTVAVMPETPAVTVTSAAAESARISWDALNGAAGYQIWMADAEDGSYSIVKSVTDGNTAYTKYDLTSGADYYFKVRAYTEVNGKKTFGAYSEVISVTVQ